MRDVSEADLQCLLRFMYHGEVQIAEEHLKDFLKTAESLQVRGLAEGTATATPAGPEDTNEVSEEERLMLRRRRLMRRRTNNDSNEDEAVDATTTSTREQCQKTSSSVSGTFLFSYNLSSIHVVYLKHVQVPTSSKV
jgi:hypothetical protein